LASVAGPGERTFTLSSSDLHLPEGVRFQRAIPSQLRLRFGRRKMKEVPVQARFVFAPPDGYLMTKHEVIPANVRIAGPEHRVDGVASVQTDAIDLSGFTQSGEVRINAMVAEPQVWLESSPTVTVRVTVEKVGK